MLPYPPSEYQTLVCGPDRSHLFSEAGAWLVAFLDHERMLQPGAHFLDVGSGCGRVARQLMDRDLGSYTGFDRHPGMVEWCEREIAERDPRFRFDYFDLDSVYTTWDAQPGTTSVEAFAFPYPARMFDSALLASVFTHMPRAEAVHYLGELTRVMRPGGKVLLSVFFGEDGECQPHDLNFLYDPGLFLADLERLPFDVRHEPHHFEPGQPFDPAPSGSGIGYEYVQNWFVLTRR